MDPGRFTSAALSLVGWKFETELPKERQYVMLASPHTSNWDGLLLVSLGYTVGLRLHWMVKDSWVKGPRGAITRRVGAVGIDRSRARNIVDQMVEQFRTHDDFVLAIPPEGTRARTEYWKSGFYHIARGAQVPVVPGYLDFARKRAGLGPAITMTGDVRADMDRIRAFYAQQNPIGLHPAKWGPIRLKEEETGPTP